MNGRTLPTRRQGALGAVLVATALLAAPSGAPAQPPAPEAGSLVEVRWSGSGTTDQQRKICKKFERLRAIVVERCGANHLRFRVKRGKKVRLHDLNRRLGSVLRGTRVTFRGMSLPDRFELVLEGRKDERRDQAFAQALREVRGVATAEVGGPGRVVVTMQPHRTLGTGQLIQIFARRLGHRGSLLPYDLFADVVFHGPPA